MRGAAGATDIFVWRMDERAAICQREDGRHHADCLHVDADRLPLRVQEIAALGRDALRYAEFRGLTLDLRYTPDAAARVRQLVHQERTCCAFLQFDLQERAGEVRLFVTVPPEAGDAIADLLAAPTGCQHAAGLECLAKNA